MERQYQAGTTMKELGQRFGISRETVSTLLKERGVNVRYQPLDRKQIELTKLLYEQGLSLVKVGNRLSRNQGTVWRALKDEGVEMRNR